MDYNEYWLDLLNSDWTLNAIITLILTSILCASLSFFIIVRKQVFYTHTMSHIGFPGAIICYIFGINLSIGLVVFCLLGGVIISRINKQAKNTDIATSLVLCFSLGLGTFLSNFSNKGQSRIEEILFGNLVTVTIDQTIITLCILLVSIFVLLFIYKPLLLSSISPQIANAKGVNNKNLEIVFMILLSFACASSIQIIGSLLVFALLILPSSISSTFSANPKINILLAITISLFCSLLGFILSLMFTIPSSFSIVFVYTIFYVVSKFFGK